MEVAFQAEAEDSNIGMCLVHIKSGKEARVWGGGVSVPLGNQMYMISAGRCKDLGFYSEGNEGPSDVFEQRAACG